MVVMVVMVVVVLMEALLAVLVVAPVMTEKWEWRGRSECWPRDLEELEEHALLVLVLDEFELLRDELGSGADAADGDKNVVRQKLHRHALDLLGEGGREHERLALRSSRHALLRRQRANVDEGLG
eukprot:37264-Pleurochrysis_carterae.AAC.1